MALKLRKGLTICPKAAEQYYERLKSLVGARLELHVHRNRSVLLRFERALFKTRLFLHEAFLSAPEEIAQALSTYVRSSARDRVASSLLNGFVETIETKKAKRPLAIETQGTHYDLAEAFERIHAEYFESSLDVVGITWFKTPVRRGRSITLGQFDSERRLVKINGVLDSEKCPPFFLDFVVFHELLHAKIPPTFDAKRRRRVIHGPDFRQAERAYPHYRDAVAFQREHFGRHLGRWI